MDSSDREFDLIIYGASGFTGSLAFEYLYSMQLQQHYRENSSVAVFATLPLDRQRDFHHRKVSKKTVGTLRWAVAGRNGGKIREMMNERLKQMIDDPSRSVPLPSILEADPSDEASIVRLVKKTRCVLSFAGPFLRFGTPLLKNCAIYGTHYCDSTGEIPWVVRMRKQYNDAAVKSGAIIVNMCGFDSIPSDLSVFYGVTKLREKYGANTCVLSARNYISMLGAFSGGTLASGIEMESSPENKKFMEDPFALGGGPVNETHLKNSQDYTGMMMDPDIDNNFRVPFGMSQLNTKVVRRSSADLKYRTDGEGFVYQEVGVATTKQQAEKMSKGEIPLEKRKEMIAKGRLPKPGEGPSLEMQRSGWFQVLSHVTAKEGDLWVSVTGGEPGYTDTALMCVEAALCLVVEDPAALRCTKGGFYTPAGAFGSVAIERLQNAGIKFSVVQNGSRLRTKL